MGGIYILTLKILSESLTSNEKRFYKTETLKCTLRSEFAEQGQIYICKSFNKVVWNSGFNISELFAVHHLQGLKQDKQLNIQGKCCSQDKEKHKYNIMFAEIKHFFHPVKT